MRRISFALSLSLLLEPPKEITSIVQRDVLYRRDNCSLVSRSHLDCTFTTHFPRLFAAPLFIDSNAFVPSLHAYDQVSLRGNSSKEVSRAALLSKAAEERAARSHARKSSAAAALIQVRDLNMLLNVPCGHTHEHTAAAAVI